jgi:hypothetical protein
MIESNAWQELVLEVIQAAKKRMTVRDFKKFCQLAPVEPAKSYYDRQRVADFLIETGVVEIDEGDLRLNRKILKNHPNWLLAGLKQWYETSWNILSEIDSANKISGKIELINPAIEASSVIINLILIVSANGFCNEMVCFK